MGTRAPDRLLRSAWDILLYRACLTEHALQSMRPAAEWLRCQLGSEEWEHTAAHRDEGACTHHAQYRGVWAHAIE